MAQSPARQAQSRFLFSLGAFCLSALTAAPATAADDTQVWLTGIAAWSLADNLDGNIEVSRRYRADGDQLLIRVAADRRLAPGVQVGLGAAFVEFEPGHEIRLHQQIVLTHGAFSLRTRLEERSFASAARPEWRLRQKVGAVYPIGAMRVSVGGEILYVVQPRIPGQSPRVDQWRLGGALQSRLAAHLEGSLGYLLIVSPRPGPNRYSHVPLLTVSLRR